MKGKHALRAAGAWLAGIVVIAAAGLASCSSPVAGGSTITPIYAATNGGLSVFDGTTWTNYTTADGLASNTVNGVSVVGSGSDAFVYAATSLGLSYNEGSGWKKLTTADGLASNDVTGVFIGSNYLYMVTGGGLSVFNYTTGHISSPTAAWGAATAVNGVFSDGATYVATGAGLWVSGVGGWTSYTSSATNGFPSGAVNAVFVDSSSNIYVATTDTTSGTGHVGIWSASSGTWSTITIPGVATVNCLFVDSYGDIYAGTGSGLFVSTDGGSTWTNYTTTDGLGSNTVNGIFVAGQAIYLATGSGAGTGGVSVSTDSGTTWKNYTIADGLRSNTVNGIYVTAPLYSY